MTLVACRDTLFSSNAPLSTACCMIYGVMEQLQLVIGVFSSNDMSTEETFNEVFFPVNNPLGRLLLPDSTPQTMLQLIQENGQKSVMLHYDTEGRVHQLILDNCLFLVLMDLWAPSLLKEEILRVKSVSHEEHRIFLMQTFPERLLRLPAYIPQEFSHFTKWKPPQGTYSICSDQWGRVFSIRGTGNDTTYIVLDHLWNSRLFPLGKNNTNDGGMDPEIVY